ncbi:hypothetical protein BESB_009470 [Besnoitia besnoiti]|uniref:Uncharacterized protein n=1 Tax=Besnoitia besnoiti TaxID=94643 RepID=A0A2A9MKS9_BESBE|nr:hypothetical protein BESB_009470 [Besnoitia besnoiti]PFH38605.1 hypothetical protein BESB_009470 [Besnoitia besnoiti]
MTKAARHTAFLVSRFVSFRFFKVSRSCVLLFSREPAKPAGRTAIFFSPFLSTQRQPPISTNPTVRHARRTVTPEELLTKYYSVSHAVFGYLCRAFSRCVGSPPGLGPSPQMLFLVLSSCLHYSVRFFGTGAAPPGLSSDIGEVSYMGDCSRPTSQFHSTHSMKPMQTAATSASDAAAADCVDTGEKRAHETRHARHCSGFFVPRVCPFNSADCRRLRGYTRVWQTLRLAVRVERRGPGDRRRADKTGTQTAGAEATAKHDGCARRSRHHAPANFQDDG